MKVTALNPVYGTEKISDAVVFFSKLGFKEIHSFEKEGFEIITLENESGIRLDIMNNDYVREAGINGFFANRLNVDDLEEALDFFKSEGAEQVSPIIYEADSRELANVRTKNGDIYSVIHHIKK